MQPFRFFFHYTKGQRKGIVALLLLIIITQIVYFVITSRNWQSNAVQTAEQKEWLALQAQIDTLKAQQAKKKYKTYRFNPNYISDYKGYTLGMSTAEIDRLHKFRETKKYVNSAEEFQEVTKVSDSLLAKISPYFKFPAWVKNKKGNKKVEIYPFNPNYITDYKAKLIGLSSKQLARIREFRKTNKYVNSPEEFQQVTKVSDSLLKAISPYFKFPDWVNERNARNKALQNSPAIDINKATADDLIAIYGIGPVYSKRILERREQLGAYVSMEQMDDFDFRDYTPGTNNKLKERFAIISKPQIIKINVNTASVNELSRFPYFDNSIAKTIIAKREGQGKINTIEELTKIIGFPVEKEKIIALYLEF